MPKSLISGVMNFLGWWRDELGELVPSSVRRMFVAAERYVVLAQVDGGFQVFEDGASEVAGTTVLAPAIVSRERAVTKLAELAEAGSATAAAIRLPLGQCLVRRVELPNAARRDIRPILNLDLERATPFRVKDVYTAHIVEDEGGAKGKLRLRQIVAKREVVDPLIEEVRAAGLEVAFVDCWTETPRSALAIDFLEPSTAAAGMARRFTLPRALAVLAVVLLVAAGVLLLSRYEAALDEVQAKTARMRAQAATVRGVLERSDAAVAGLSRLQQRKLKQVPTIEVLEEVSRLLPDSVWLADLRIEGDTMDMSGLAQSGAALLPLFERSNLLAAAALTAPLTLDPREDKERFSLRIRIRSPVVSPEAAKSEGSQ